MPFWASTPKNCAASFAPLVCKGHRRAQVRRPFIDETGRRFAGRGPLEFHIDNRFCVRVRSDSGAKAVVSKPRATGPLAMALSKQHCISPPRVDDDVGSGRGKRFRARPSGKGQGNIGGERPRRDRHGGPAFGDAARQFRAHHLPSSCPLTMMARPVVAPNADGVPIDGRQAPYIDDFPHRVLSARLQTVSAP